MDLGLLAQKLKKTDLFSVSSSTYKFQYKQKIFLVASGVKPVCEVVSYHWKKAEHGLIPISDDQNKVGLFLEEIGLFYEIRKIEFPLHIIISKTKKHLVKLKSALNSKSFYELGILFGYPKTAVRAFLDRENLCLSIEEQFQILRKKYAYGKLLSLFNFRLSKKYYVREIEEVKKWFRVLDKFNLV